MEWNGMEWNGMEWNGMEWNGMEWNGMEWNGMEWNASYYDLGILVSSNLTWDDHYSAIISKAYRAMYFIRCATSHSLSSQTNCHSTKVWLDRTSLIAPKYGVLTK